MILLSALFWISCAEYHGTEATYQSARTWLEYTSSPSSPSSHPPSSPNAPSESKACSDTDLITDSIFRGDGTYEGLWRHPEISHVSQYKQDMYIDRLLRRRKGGFFVEMGAFDGELYSNTLFLERARGWDGLLIEPNPVTFEQLTSKDRKCWALHGCLGASPSLTFRLAGGMTAPLQLMSKHHSDRLDYAVPKMILAKDSKGLDFLRYRGSGEEVPVRCFNLKSVLGQLWNQSSRSNGTGGENQSSVRHIDYFSLDVEGGEMDVLENLPWGSVTIEVMTVEVQENRQEIHTFMLSKGYRLVSTFDFDNLYILERFLQEDKKREKTERKYNLEGLPKILNGPMTNLLWYPDQKALED